MKSKILHPTCTAFACLALITTLQNKVQGQCPPSIASHELNINNVNAMILTGGDMWWDLIGAPRYEVPRGSGINAFFAKALWIGGLDANSNLRLAGQRYRAQGNDYWTGPLDHNGNLVNADCSVWDKIFVINRSEIDDFLDNGTITTNLEEWPGRANPHISAPDQPLAPFIDMNNDSVYNPNDGDYPDIKGDQALWMVLNDKGNTHTATGGLPIGVEIHVMAYAYASNDHLNNTTFYDYTIIKKSPGTLYDTYIGFFVDPDLGNPQDDYVASHSGKNLGIAFNGDTMDENIGGALGYGTNPPSAAYKFIETPTDSNGDTIGMTSFMYFNNDMSVVGDPQTDVEYYNYLRGYWRDSTQVTMGGNGYDTSGNAVPYPYMYDQALTTGTWSECSAGNIPFDRRFVMSSGGFDLQPHQPVHFTNAAIWAENPYPATCDSLDHIVAVSDSVTTLYYEKLAADTGSSPGDTTGIGEIERQLFRVFPNPSATGNFKVELTEGQQGDITITDMKGRVIAQFMNRQGIVELHGLKPGAYLLQVTGNKERQRAKLLVH